MIFPYIVCSILGGIVGFITFWHHGWGIALLAAWAGATLAGVLLACWIAFMRREKSCLSRLLHWVKA